MPSRVTSAQRGQQLATGLRTGLGSGFRGLANYLQEGRREGLELPVELRDREAELRDSEARFDAPAEAIGDPKLFVGRRKQMARLLKWTEGTKRRLRALSSPPPTSSDHG